jgi:hypothetical protein
MAAGSGSIARSRPIIEKILSTPFGPIVAAVVFRFGFSQRI